MKFPLKNLQIDQLYDVAESLLAIHPKEKKSALLFIRELFTVVPVISTGYKIKLNFHQ